MPTTAIEQLLEVLTQFREATEAQKKEGCYLADTRNARCNAFTQAWEAYGYDRTGFVACRYGQILEFSRVEGGYSLDRSALLTSPLTTEAWEALPEASRQLKTAAEMFLAAEEREDAADADYEEAEGVVKALKIRLQGLMEVIGEGQYLCGDQVLTIKSAYQGYEGYEGKLSSIL